MKRTAIAACAMLAGRQCSATGITKIVDMQYEITYQCDQSLSVTPPA